MADFNARFAGPAFNPHDAQAPRRRPLQYAKQPQQQRDDEKLHSRSLTNRDKRLPRQRHASSPLNVQTAERQ